MITIHELPIEQVHRAPQVRTEFDEHAINGLALSMRAVGQLVPIRVRRHGDAFLIVDGERRWRAARKLDQTTIAAIIEERELEEADIVQRQLVANCQRADLTPLEKARATRRLMESAGWNASETARQLGLSNSAVSRLQALLELPEAIQQQIEQGKIAPATAYELTKIADPARQAQLAQDAASGKRTRDGVSAEVGRTAEQREAHEPRLSRARLELGEGRSVTAVAPELTLDSFIAGLKDAQSQAQKARAKGLSLRTWLKMSREAAGAAR